MKSKNNRSLYQRWKHYTESCARAIFGPDWEPGDKTLLFSPLIVLGNLVLNVLFGIYDIVEQIKGKK